MKRTYGEIPLAKKMAKVIADGEIKFIENFEVLIILDYTHGYITISQMDK